MSAAGVLAGLAFLAGSGLVVAGVYELVGLGWALIVGAVPWLLFSLVLLRGILR